MCGDAELQELTAAVVSALPYCLPSLAGTSCTASNCTQAVNTYLGRFVANGAVCRCQGVEPPSGMLQTLDIDAAVLLEACGGESELLELRPCAPAQAAARGEARSGPQTACAHDPELYRSRSGCARWSWAKLESGMLEEWGRAASFEGRATRAEAVASAECGVLVGLMALYFNLEHPDHLMLHIAEMFGAGEPIFTHPTAARLYTSHRDVVWGLRQPQARSRNSVKFSMCFYGSWDQLVNAPLTPTVQPTGSLAHQAARAVLFEVSPSLPPLRSPSPRGWFLLGFRFQLASSLAPVRSRARTLAHSDLPRRRVRGVPRQRHRGAGPRG